MKKTIRDIDISGKRAVVRCDFNVPMQDGNIADDTRIRAALPTIKYLLERNCKVFLLSHMGRPKGKANPEFSLKKVAERLSEMIGKNVVFLQSDNVVDNGIIDMANQSDDSVFLLENVRFRREETENEKQFAKELARLGDVFVNDAFGAAHRAHASTCGIAEYLPAVSGLLIEREIAYLGNAVENPKRPLLAIMGGAKVSDKILLIENLLNKVDYLIIGGGMAYTFFKAKGYEIGTSLLDEESVELAGQLMKKAEEKGVKMFIPVDTVCGKEFKNDTEIKIVNAQSIPKDMMGLDIGPKSVDLFSSVIDEANTIIWNGPMGVFEMENFEFGTRALATKLAQSESITIIGGGDSAAAAQKFALSDRMTHISTGGGASMEYLEGKILPGIDVLEDK